MPKIAGKRIEYNPEYEADPKVIAALDAYIEPTDVMKYYNDAALRLLDGEPRKIGDATVTNFAQLREQIQTIIDDYGRVITQTLTDANLERYTEKFIIKALRKVFIKYARNYIILPDYSTTDGRLHFHGVFNLKTIKDLAKLKKALKQFGFLKLDEFPREGTPEYITKIYEKNKFTPVNLNIEKLYKKNILYNII